jgi:hypothetical protein
MYPTRDYVDLGGLMSYAYRNAEMFRAAATFVDKILKGHAPVTCLWRSGIDTI